eukprot:m.15307 g.15307  ORF g.15307 m.15307 type:complete len:59 (-) comp5347_c0_seq1:104-280(-)
MIVGAKITAKKFMDAKAQLLEERQRTQSKTQRSVSSLAQKDSERSRQLSALISMVEKK